MKVYRISKTQFCADLSGEGARLHGGRWNHIQTPCLYTSSTRALALLEYTVNIPIEFIPKTLSIVTIEVPDDNIWMPKVAELPVDWTHSPAPASTKDLGTRMLVEKKYLSLKVPSVIVQQEYNFILNPIHPNFKEVKLFEIEIFTFDKRLLNR